MEELLKKQFVVHVGTLLVLLLIVAGAGWIGVSVLRGQDRLLATANEREDRYRQDNKELLEALKQSEEQRVELAQRQKVVVREIEKRDESAGQQIAQVTQPDKDIQQVAQDVQTYLNISPEITLNKLAFWPHDVQKIVAVKIERDKFEGDLKDTKSLLDLEKKKSTSLETDLAGAQKQLTEADQVIGGYKAAAKKSFLRKFADRAKDIGIAVGIAVVVKETLN